MSKHLKPEEWFYFFNRYKNRKSDNFFWIEYSEKKQTKKLIKKLKNDLEKNITNII